MYPEPWTLTPRGESPSSGPPFPISRAEITGHESPGLWAKLPEQSAGCLRTRGSAGWARGSRFSGQWNPSWGDLAILTPVPTTLVSRREVPLHPRAAVVD